MSQDVDDDSKDVRVSDLMAKDPIMVDSERSVRETAITMDRAGHGCLLVTADGKIVGIVTERDLVRRALTKGGIISHTKVKNIMSSPLIVVNPEVSIKEAAKVMAHHKVRRLPVVGSNGLTGLITATDIAKYLAKHSEHSSLFFNAIARKNVGIYT